MPIKFRCNHCRQFLGISRAKAEQVVDCPTCGRSIRVPSLDGIVSPLPKPKLDLQDESLVDALNRLAEIGEQQSSDLVLANADTPADESASDDLIGDSLDPVPMPEVQVAPSPVPIEPPELPPQVVAPVVPSSPTRPSGSAPEEDDSKSDTVAQLARDAERGLGRSRPGERTTNWPVLVIATVACACAGFAAGRFSAPARSTSPTDGRAAANDPNPASSEREASTAIAGSVMFKTETGDSPDVGACVIALPAERGGTIRLSIVGFRPGDTVEDWRVARAGLRALGGDASLVDDDGEFSLSLTEAGTYQLLVLSRYQGRDTDTPIPPAVDETLNRFFDRPRQLLGQARFEIQSIRWAGETAAKWSHTFPVAES